MVLLTAGAPCVIPTLGEANLISVRAKATEGTLSLSCACCLGGLHTRMDAAVAVTTGARADEFPFEMINRQPLTAVNIDMSAADVSEMSDRTAAAEEAAGAMW